jgi:hypothetical protein
LEIPSGLKVLKIAQNLAQTQEKLFQVIPSYAKKHGQTHRHKMMANLLEMPKIQ